MEKPLPDIAVTPPPVPPLNLAAVPEVGRRAFPLRVPGREALVGLTVAVVVSALGALMGLVWRAAAPQVELVRTAYGWYPTSSEPEGFIADDGWFALLSAGAGLLIAATVWWALRRWRGPAVLVGLAVGSFAAALLAAWVGHRLGLTEYDRQIREAAVGTKVRRLVSVRTDSAKFIQAAVAVAVYTLLAAFHESPSLDRTPGEPPFELHNSPGVDLRKRD